MNKQDIIEYVMNTPGNTNRAVLNSMLDQLIKGSDSFSTIEDICVPNQKVLMTFHNEDENFIFSSGTLQNVNSLNSSESASALLKIIFNFDESNNVEDMHFDTFITLGEFQNDRYVFENNDVHIHIIQDENNQEQWNLYISGNYVEEVGEACLLEVIEISYIDSSNFIEPVEISDESSETPPKI